MPCILLIEDNPGDARLIQELLRDADTVPSTQQITHVERVSEALQVLDAEAGKIDVILSDIALPDSTGLDTLTALTSAGANLPIIFMTGTNDEHLALTAIKQGAQDYIIKGRSDGDTLARTIRYAMERKKFQLELDAVRLKERLNEERIRLLAQEKRQLVALSKAKDEFISLASHQLRTPASAVKQYLGMITEGYMGDIDGKLLEVIQIAFDSNERQLEVINDLLKTAQLDSESHHMHLQRGDIGSILQEVMTNLRPSTDMRHQTVAYHPTEPLMAMFDYHELYLAFENICSNASKYSPADTTITISSSRSKYFADIIIQDQGVGIAAKDQKRVFDKFTRVDNALSDTVNGNGLGLYWVKRIVRMHHGKVSIKSAINEGTQFKVSIPL